MKTRTLGLALAGTMLAGLALAADLPAVTDGEPTLGTRPPANVGDVYLARKDWSAARDAYLEAIKDTATLYNKVGICHQRLGDYAAARAAYTTALELRPDYAQAWNNLGTIDHIREDYARAVHAYEKAIALDATDALIYRNLGQAWLAQDQVEKALQAWSRALRLDPEVLTSDEGAIRAGALDLGQQYFIFAKLISARGDVDRALELLGMAREHGFSDFGMVERDPDFTSVVQDPRWASWSR